MTVWLYSSRRACANWVHLSFESPGLAGGYIGRNLEYRQGGMVCLSAVKELFGGRGDEGDVMMRVALFRVWLEEKIQEEEDAGREEVS